MNTVRLLIALLVLAPTSVLSQPFWIEESRFVYDPGVSPDGLGESVAVHGQRAILGAPALGIANHSAGYAVAVEFEDGAWNQAQKLEADDGVLDDRFGYAVALGESIAVVGAPEAGFVGDRTGAAYVFTEQGGEWTQQLRLLPDDAEGGLEYGTSVAVHGNTVLVGAPIININHLRTGEAYIYELEDGAVSLAQRLQFGDFSFVAAFGESVALGDGLAAIGTPNRGEGAQNFGSVFLYARTDEGWEFDDELRAADAQPQDIFGSSVSLDGEWLFVGAPREDDGAANAGAVYVFRNTNGTWTEVDRLKAPTPVQDDLFGESVSVSGTAAVVGASSNDEQGSGSGTMYVFEFDGDEWQFVEQLFASDAAIGDNMAKSVSMSGDVIVAGAAGSNGDDAEESVGAAYFFRRDAANTSIGETPDGLEALLTAVIYPNPVREAATVEVETPRLQHVDLSLYDLLGRQVKVLHRGALQPGLTHRFGVSVDGLSSGVYLLRLEGEQTSASRPLFLMK
jgi:hypothetical protein